MPNREQTGGKPRSDVWQVLREMAPEYASAAEELLEVPAQRGALSPRVRELVLVAVNAAVTHMHRPALRTHVRGALDHGATAAEIVEVFQLVSVLGIHSITIGFPALSDEARKAGREGELPLPPLDRRQEDLKASFIEARGYWNDFWESVLLLDMPLFEAYARFSSVPWRSGVLEPKVREFVYVAIDASTTHMFDEGTRGHMANAFRHGATVAELVEVLELTSGIGIQSVTTGLAILLDELQGREG